MDRRALVSWPEQRLPGPVSFPLFKIRHHLEPALPRHQARESHGRRPCDHFEQGCDCSQPAVGRLRRRHAQLFRPRTRQHFEVKLQHPVRNFAPQNPRFGESQPCAVLSAVPARTHRVETCSAFRWWRTFVFNYNADRCLQRFLLQAKQLGVVEAATR